MSDREPDGQESDAAASSPTTGGAEGDPSFDGTVALPPCKPGFDPDDDPSRFCAYVDSDGLCYDTKIAACACECPKTTGTVCTSPLFPPPSEIPVSCR